MKKIMFNKRYGLEQAVLDLIKMLTRRIAKYQCPGDDYEMVFPVFFAKDFDKDGNNISPLNGAFGWRNKKDGSFTGWNIPMFKVGEVVAIAQSYKDGRMTLKKKLCLTIK